MLGTGRQYSDIVLPVNEALVVNAQRDVTYLRNSFVEKQYAQYSGNRYSVFGVKEIIVGMDKQFQEIGDDEWIRLLDASGLFQAA